jgi:hypothetical protein
MIKLIIILILIALLIILLREAGCFGSFSPATPASLSISPNPTQIRRGGLEAFTITATLSDTATSRRIVSVRIDEDDRWDDVLAYVDITIPDGSVSGSATFDLSCTADDKLTGAAGESESESEYNIHAEFQRSLLPNITSANHALRCVAETNH